jgi:antirestriction protein ArdC
MARDIYSEITDMVITELDKGTVPWRKPWTSHNGEYGQRNLQSKRPYRGINAMLCEMRAMSEGWDLPYWTTYKACAKAGGKVVKGSRGQLVTFWKRVETKDKETGEKKAFFMLRHYTVFNVAQTEGLSIPVDSEEEEERPEVLPIEVAEQVIGSMVDPPTIRNGGSRACYSPPMDSIQLPERDDFVNADAYYHTAFHELVHSTGHEKRLGRDGIMERHMFGDADYSREELIAELGAAFVSGTVGVDPDIPQSAAYIKGWMRELGKDKKLIVQAAGKAQKAADRILGVSFAE